LILDFLVYIERDLYMPDKSKMTAKEIFDIVFDSDSFNEIYTGYGNASSAHGYVNGSPAVLTVMDGVMDFATSEKICQALEFAAKNGIPAVSVYNSVGVNVEEGAAVFGYYGKVLKKVSELSGVVPQIAVTDSVCIGSLAVIAASADILIAAKSAEIYAVTGASSSDSVAVNTEDMESALKTAVSLISKLPSNNLGAIPEYEADAPVALPVVGNALEGIAEKDSLIKLYDGYGAASQTSFASIGGSLVGFVSTEKGNGLLECEDCAKISKFVNLCDAYSIPVVTILNTEGLSKNACLKAAVKLTSTYTNATTRKITLITGKAIGTVLSVFISGNADAVFAYENAVIAPLAPLTAAEFMYHDKLKGAKDLTAKRNEIAAEYEASMSAEEAAKSGLITAVITPETAYKTIASALEISQGKRPANFFDRKHSV
jgi:acetyl-CoA carboxylase carboxyltransferase component